MTQMLKTKEFKHPETKKGEVFFSNSDSNSYGLLGYKTKRIGQQAYDGEGRELQSYNWYPVFVQEEEILKSPKTLQEQRRAFRDKYEDKQL